MITNPDGSKPKTILELFEGHPERWTTKAGAKDINGKGVDADSDKAACWCIQGAYIRVHGFTQYMHDNSINYVSGLHTWNDAPERTFEEVLEKVRELGI